MERWINHLLALLALPQYSLSTVFVVSFASATLLPFWPCVLYMAPGKFLRHLILTSTLLGIFS